MVVYVAYVRIWRRKCFWYAHSAATNSVANCFKVFSLMFKGRESHLVWRSCYDEDNSKHVAVRWALHQNYINSAYLVDRNSKNTFGRILKTKYTTNIAVEDNTVHPRKKEKKDENEKGKEREKKNERHEEEKMIMEQKRKWKWKKKKGNEKEINTFCRVKKSNRNDSLKESV